MNVMDLISDLLDNEDGGQQAKPHPTETVKPRNVTRITPTVPAPASEAAIVRAMEVAVTGLPILPAEFRACVDDDEAIHVATGRIPMKSARAYARLFAQQLAQDPAHPSNHGQATCWACRHYRARRCLRSRTASPDQWIECSDYREVQK